MYAIIYEISAQMIFINFIWFLLYIKLCYVKYPGAICIWDIGMANVFFQEVAFSFIF